MALPAIVCLKSLYNNKYLHYLNNSEQTHGLLQFSGEKYSDPAAQFEVVDAQIGGGLIHLKSRFTKKYFVRWSPNHYWITPAADEPNEHKTEWSSTLFRLEIIEDNGTTKKIRLMHVQLGNYLYLHLLGFQTCLFALRPTVSPDSQDIFTVLDYSYFSKLPKNVAFKGDNGKYLGAFPYNGRPHLQFSFDDPNDPKVAHEVINFLDGTICIKSKYFDKIWRLYDLDHMFIVADTTMPEHYSARNWRTLFRPNFVDINVVGLQNMDEHNHYVKRFTIRDMVNLLSAFTTMVDQSARLEVIDLGE